MKKNEINIIFYYYFLEYQKSLFNKFIKQKIEESFLEKLEKKN